MRIVFTKHAEDKFSVLRKYGVLISRRKVIETVESPELVDHSRRPLVIFQSVLNKSHVLRVVCRRTIDGVLIITFYPGKKSQYDEKK